MKRILTFAFVLFVAMHAQAEQYLSEAQKEKLLEESAALGSVREIANTQEALNKSEVEKFLQKVATTSNSVDYIEVPNKLAVTKTRRNPAQSTQSMFRNTQFGKLTYKNRPIALASQSYVKSHNHRPAQRPSQVKKKSKKFKWSSFFNTLSNVAAAINSGLGQTNSQFRTQAQYSNRLNISQPNYLNSLQPNSLNIRTQTFGNQTLGVGGDVDYRSYGVGNMEFGRIGNQEFQKHNFGGTSIMKIGESKLVCRKVGNQEICN
jgi:hypothetical protein